MNITHDFHIHTKLSPCAKETATVQHYLKKAKELQLKKIGFADHFWDSAIKGANEFYEPQSYEHLLQLKSELSELNTDGIEVFWGCEAEYDAVRRDVAITEETAEKFDFVIVPNSHTHMMMPGEYYNPYQKHANFMVQAYEDILNSSVSRYITAMAHPFKAVCCPYDYSILINLISDDRFKRLFEQTAKKNIAVEINLAIYRTMKDDEIEQSALIRMSKLAKESGCKFIFGSDSHSDKGHNTFARAELIADILDLKEDDIAEIAK